MKQPLIELKNIYKKFGDEPILQGVNLSIYKGEVTAIIGQSGCGKSVLLKHIIGLILQDSGEILFRGIPLNQMSKKEKSSVKQKFSYMFQGSALFDSMTVFENVALPLMEKKIFNKHKIEEKVNSMLDKLGLHGIDNKYPAQLSGGMKKRIALSRALITEPEIVLFDEPTTGLDPVRKQTVHEMIADYQLKFGYTGILISHEIPDVFYISQRIAMLSEGKIIFEGSPDEIVKVDDINVQLLIQERRLERLAK